MPDKILINGPITNDLISSILGSLGDKTDAGGNSVFLGQVRADSNGKTLVRAIEYSTYGTMAETEAERIKNLIFSEFDDVKSVVILHSTGIVNAGEISLFVMVSAGHRQQALNACSKTVELIKSNLPVWKKEIFEDGSGGWKQDSYA